MRARSPSPRRRFLQGSLAAGSLFLPAPWAWVWAQSEGAVKLLRAPKLALVVGNAAYRAVPALKNPGNDARAIAKALGESGFEVTLVQDATHGAMLEAIDAYAKALAARKGVGLFYFAGHGLQMQWRNYLLPVDAKVASASDVAAQCVDISGLMGGVRSAANPMNVVILDACRDNPFAGDVRPEQKGLSQMDAPTGTLLAYATAPGNTADDGPGVNGLYTENLLREMKVREAKIEDVFKRVRLGVRRASGGRQIPWESTSLEEDFYFVPPEQLRKLSAAEEEREFREEFAVFEKVKEAKDPAPLEQYLRRYPSGRFAELAQLRLDAVLAAQGERPVEPAPAQGNPFTAGTVRAGGKARVGDRLSYDVIDRLSWGGKATRLDLVVTEVTDAHVMFNNGLVVRDLMGNTVRTKNGQEFSPRQDHPLEYAVGKKWSTRYDVSRKGAVQGTVTMEFRVAARETVTVPAGTFDCFRVEGHGVNRRREGPPVDVYITRWNAPGRVRGPVAIEEVRRATPGGHVKVLFSERMELASFEQR
ncbi:MAG: caspase family protein [Betaproteobacteria bacterium]|nr:caspase family protein [Betaproteobacteria bacterium]